MNPPAADGTTIPARLTAKELARAIGRDVSEVSAALQARNEPHSPDDFLDAKLSEAIARALGASVTIETRDLVLEALYEHETRGEVGYSLPDRAQRVLVGVIDGREDLDRLIEGASEHWSVARMPVIDRNILRLGLYELQNDPDTPAPVVISEAVRLAQAYSTERSGAFVNGVLANLAESARA